MIFKLLSRFARNLSVILNRTLEQDLARTGIQEIMCLQGKSNTVLKNLLAIDQKSFTRFQSIMFSALIRAQGIRLARFWIGESSFWPI